MIRGIMPAWFYPAVRQSMSFAAYSRNLVDSGSTCGFETCGVFVKDADEAYWWVPIRNVLASDPGVGSLRAFMNFEADMDQVERQLRMGRTIEAFVHTHTNGDPRPSRTDVENGPWSYCDLAYIVAIPPEAVKWSQGGDNGAPMRSFADRRLLERHGRVTAYDRGGVMSGAGFTMGAVLASAGLPFSARVPGWEPSEGVVPSRVYPWTVGPHRDRYSGLTEAEIGGQRIGW